MPALLGRFSSIRSEEHLVELKDTQPPRGQRTPGAGGGGGGATEDRATTDEDGLRGGIRTGRSTSCYGHSRDGQRAPGRVETG